MRLCAVSKLSRVLFGVPVAVLLLLVIGGLFPVKPLWSGFPTGRLRYEFPQNLALALSQTSCSATECVLEATFESRVGVLQNLTSHVTASPGWKPAHQDKVIEQLQHGHPRTLLIRLVPDASVTPTLRPDWVVLRVSYLPDYRALAEILNDVAQYPDTLERERLLTITQRNHQAKSIQTDGLRLDLPPSSAAGESTTKGVAP